MARLFSPPRFALLLLVLACTAVFGAGCAVVRGLGDPRERPESLEPAVVAASPQCAYEAALTLAFDRGYQILYSDERDRLIELESLDRRLFGNDRVRRIDLFVRAESGKTRVHARVHSFAANDPGDLDVTDDDREAARTLVDRLVEHLNGRPLPRKDASR